MIFLWFSFCSCFIFAFSHLYGLLTLQSLLLVGFFAHSFFPSLSFEKNPSFEIDFVYFSLILCIYLLLPFCFCWYSFFYLGYNSQCHQHRRWIIRNENELFSIRFWITLSCSRSLLHLRNSLLKWMKISRQWSIICLKYFLMWICIHAIYLENKHKIWVMLSADANMIQLKMGENEGKVKREKNSEKMGKKGKMCLCHKPKLIKDNDTIFFSLKWRALAMSRFVFM